MIIAPSYKGNVAAMVEAWLAQSVKLVLITPTPLGEDPGNESNKQLAGYVEFLRDYGKEKLLAADVNLRGNYRRPANRSLGRYLIDVFEDAALGALERALLSVLLVFVAEPAHRLIE